MPWSKKPTPLKIVVIGEAQVGKTCFIDMVGTSSTWSSKVTSTIRYVCVSIIKTNLVQFLEGKHFIRHPIDEPLTRTFTFASTTYNLQLTDLDLSGSISPDYLVVLDTYIAAAEGIILLYDITSRYSFDRVTKETYMRVWHARNTVFRKTGDLGKMEGLKKRFGCVVVGNKRDLVNGEDGEKKRGIDKEEAEQWAESQGFRGLEVSSNNREEVEEAVNMLVKSVERAKRMDNRDDEDSRAAGKGSSTRRSVGALLKKAFSGST
jgi:GTPase SAR1 family protein